MFRYPRGPDSGEAAGQPGKLGLRSRLGWSETWGKGVSCESTPGIRGYPEDPPHPDYYSFTSII